MGARLIKIASVYFILGVCFGMFMSISQQFQFASVHAHINLVGWASLALAGLVYSVYPKAGESKLGKAHFWFHNIGLPIMMLALIIFVIGVKSMEPVIAVGGVLTTIGVILFVINVFKNVHLSEAKSQVIADSKTKSL